MAVVASGRSAQVSTRLTSSGSALLQKSGSGRSASMSGSRNHECRSSSRSSSSSTLIERLSCCHISRTTSSREHCIAGRPSDPGCVPVGDVDREDAAHVAVAELLGRHAAPELELRDARQRPFGVDVNHVPVRHRHVAAQIELHAVHPFDVRRQRAQIGELRDRRTACWWFTSGAMRSSGSAAT